MDVLILGFYSDMNRHSLAEVYLYLLVFGIMTLLMGRYLEQRRAGNSYLRLIRFKKESVWWRRLAMGVLAGSIMETALLFILCFGLEKATGYEIGAENWHLSYLLWATSFLTLSLFQMIMIQWGNGYKWSFLLVLLITGISIYAWKMPGSVWMLRRSGEMVKDGYSVQAVLIVQWIADIGMGLWGYRIRRRR